MTTHERLLDIARRVRELDPDALAAKEFRLRQGEIIAALRCLAAVSREQPVNPGETQ